jgi:hypothetical protein
MFLNYANTGRLFDDMPDLDVEFRSYIAEGSWPVKLIGDEEKAPQTVDAEKETTLLARTRSKTKAVKEEASRKRKRPSTTTDAVPMETSKPAKDTTSLSFTDILALYHFANFRDVPGLADVAVSVMLEKIAATGELPVQVLEYLLEQIPEQIPEREDGEPCRIFAMLVNIAACVVSSADFCAHMNDIPQEFLIGVLILQRKIAAEEHKRITQENKPYVPDADYGRLGYREAAAPPVRYGFPLPHPQPQLVQPQPYHRRPLDYYVGPASPLEAPLRYPHSAIIKACKWHLH